MKVEKSGCQRSLEDPFAAHIDVAEALVEVRSLKKQLLP